MPDKAAATPAAIPCCPELEPCDACDVLDFTYRLPFRPLVQAEGVRARVPVEVTLRFRYERCPGPLAMGELAYTTTLLPGEQVRLFTSDRHSRFSFDSASKLAYRHERLAEESFYTMGFARSVSDLSVLETSERTASSHESETSASASTGLLGAIFGGGSVSGSSHNAQSASTFARSLTQHAQSASSHVEAGTRAASSVSVGEVSSRAHSEGESEDHFESASRVFANPNRCHALTFFFYRINKCQTVRFRLVGVDRRVDDPAAPTGVVQNPPPPATGVSAIPTGVVATAKERLEVERQGRASVAESQVEGTRFASATLAGRSVAAAVVAPEPLAPGVVRAALAEVDKELAGEGLLDKAGNLSPAAQERFGWERQISLPTPGLLVKGCLDDCDICEDELREEIRLDLERKQLENKLLARQIELLDKAQEYRCCPEGEPV